MSLEKFQLVCSCFSCPNSILHNDMILCAMDKFKDSISIGKSITISCEYSTEYFSRDSYESYEWLKEKLDALKESNLIKEEVIVSKAKKSDGPSAKTTSDWYNK